MAYEFRLTSIAESDTAPDVLELFQKDNEERMGTGRCRGKCSNCKKPFKYFRKFGFACPDCKTMPKKFYVDLWNQKKRVRLFSDKKGMPLDSYDRAKTLLSHIRYEISNHTFNPTKYIKSEVQEYWATTLLDKFRSNKLDSLAPSYRKDYSRMTEICKRLSFSPRKSFKGLKAHMNINGSLLKNRSGSFNMFRMNILPLSLS